MRRLLILLLLTGTTAFGQRRPNFILIMSDDHAKRATSIYDSSLIRTPNIDRIASEGIRFANAFVTNSICAPSRAVQLTGQYSHLNGIRDHSDRAFDGSQTTFPKLLQKAGYHTMLVGKWHLGSAPTGFDYWNILVGQGEYYNPRFVEMGDTTTRHGYVTDIINEIALKKLDEVGDRPFCLLLHEKSPHRNWMPDTAHFSAFDSTDLPEPETLFDSYDSRSAAAKEQDMEIRDMYLSFDLKVELGDDETDPGTGGSPRFDAKAALKNALERMTDEQREAWERQYRPISDEFRRRGLRGMELEKWMYQRYIKDYLRCVLSVDDNVGELLDYLEGRGLLDNTVVIYTSDQGFFLGEHGWYDKRFMYEESIGIPLVIRYPPSIAAGSRSDRLVLNLDLAPTILDLAGVPVPASMQGESMRPLLEGRPDTNWRSAVYYHYYEYPHGWHKVKRHYGVRTDRYKLIRYYNDIDSWELFDLRNDPREMRNIVDDPSSAPIVESLKSLLTELRKRFKDTDGPW